nr:reverse transcriptase domain-containing protein [Tanacetum cinerariifolium]
TSSSGTLPSNTIANPRSDLKAITTRSGDGPQIPFPPSFLPKVVENEPESESPINSNPVTSPIFEPVIASVSAPKPNPKSSIPYPSRRNDERNRKKANNQIEKFYQIFKDMSFKISFADALILTPKFASTLKALIGNKEKLSEMARTPLNKHYFAVLLKKLPEKLGDPGKFLIPYDFPGKAQCLALADRGASINLMPLSVWNKLSLPDLTPTCMTLKLADRLISHLVRVAEDVYVKVGSFHFPVDFVVVDFDADPRVPLILERYFLKTGRALIDVFEGELTLRVGKEAITFNLDQTSRYSANYNDMTAKRINVIDMAYEDDFLLEEVDAFLAIEDDPTSPEEKTALITVLKSHKRAIAWKLFDIKGIDPEFYTHKILMEEDFEPAVQHQRIVNPKIHDVIKQEVIKLLDAGLIYPISNSPWVSHVHCVPKKGGFTVVENEDNELILTSLVTALKAEMAEINKNLMRVLQGANQGQNQPPGYQAPAYQASVYQASVHQPQILEPQVVTTNEFTNFMKANDAILKNMQTNMTSLTNSNLELKNMFGQFMKMNTTSSSGLGTLPGPRIPTTSPSLPPVIERETDATKDMVHPTNNESTEDVQPLVVLTDSLILNSEPVISPIIEPGASPDLNFNISFADALILMPKFGPSIKSLLTNKDKLCELARTLLNEHCSAILLKKLPKKLRDPGEFLIPCNFLEMAECLALADLGASINLMPLSVCNKLSLSDLSPTCMNLELANRLISCPVGVAKDVFVKVGTFHFSADFVVIDFDADPRVPLILGRSFLKVRRALIDVFEANYNDMTANRIDVIDMACEEYSQEVLGFFDVIVSGNPTPYYDPIVSTTSPTLTTFENIDFLLKEVDAFLALEDDLTSPEVDQSYVDTEGGILLLEAFLNDDPSLPLPNQGNYLPQVRKELKICEAKSDKSSIDEPLKVELKDLPPHLEYAFLEGDDKLPVIIAKNLSVEEKTALITFLKSHKRAIAWKLSDIKGIDPEFCTHKILMEEDHEPAVQHQRRVNPKIHDVIKNEVLKLLDAGLIYLISDSPWVSPVHCVPKKGGFTVVDNEENELIPTRYFQISIDPKDQEKTTFTCPYGTFAYRYTPFGLCNAPGTFQRCMTAIFHDMIEKTMEVFMDDFSVFETPPSPTVESSSEEDQNRNPYVSKNVASPITPKQFVKFVKASDSQSKTPRVTSPAVDEGSMQHTIPELTALCTSLQRQLSELTDKFQAQEVEINRLKERVKQLEEGERVVATNSGDDAPIKGMGINEGE